MVSVGDARRNHFRSIGRVPCARGRYPRMGRSLNFVRLRGRSTGLTMQGGKAPVHRAHRITGCLRAATAALAVVAAGIAVSGCTQAITQSYQRGYVLPEGALEQIPLGSSQEQVLIVLGTPSTVATISGEVFYYISQRTQQTAFLPQEEVN